MSNDTKNVLEEIAEEQDTTVSGLVEELLQSFIEGYEGELDYEDDDDPPFDEDSETDPEDTEPLDDGSDQEEEE